MAKTYAGHRIRGEPRVWIIIDGDRSKPLPWRLDFNGADRRDIVTLFKEQIKRFEGQPDVSGRS